MSIESVPCLKWKRFLGSCCSADPSRPVPVLSFLPWGAVATQRYTLRGDVPISPQIWSAQEGELGTPETWGQSCDLGHSGLHWTACATWSQASRDDSWWGLGRKRIVSAWDAITALASTENIQEIQYSILMAPSPARVPKGVPQTLWGSMWGLYPHSFWEIQGVPKSLKGAGLRNGTHFMEVFREASMFFFPDGWELRAKCTEFMSHIRPKWTEKLVMIEHLIC